MKFLLVTHELERGAASTRRWYAVYTKPRQEREAEIQLRRQGFETYLPLLRHTVRRRDRWQETIEPLFPRYLFIRLQLERDNIAPIRFTRGVAHLVHFGNSPRALPQGFVESLSAQARDGVHAQESLVFMRGDLVQILAGPFAGAKASFDIDSGKGRVSLLLNLLGRSHRLCIDRDQIAPAV